MNVMEVQPVSPRQNANILSKLFFCWLFPFLNKGSERELWIEDVYRVLPDDSSKVLSKKLTKSWENELTSRPEHPSFSRALIRMFGWKFISLGFIYFTKECILKTGQGICLGMFLRYFSGGFSQVFAAILGGALLLFSASYNMMHIPCNFASSHLGFQMRVATSGLIYRKALRLSQSSLRKTNVGQLINLLSNDVKRMDAPLAILHALWIGPLMLGIVIYILWAHIGYASLAGIAFMGVFVPLQGFGGLLFGKVRGEVAKKTDSRLRILSEVLSGIKLIKMYAWELIFLKKVDKARREEVRKIRTQMYLEAVQVGIDNMSTRAIVLITFLAYVMSDGWLSPEKVYITLFLYNTSRELMTGAFPLAISVLAELAISVGRLQALLLMEERSTTKRPEVIVGTPGSGAEVNLQNVYAKWDSSGENSLEDITFNVSKGQLLAIVGPVGSGKSSILDAILDDLPIKSGRIDVRGELVYAAQEPWVFSATLRENILFGRPLNFNWFNTVIEACGLDQDFSTFPSGDLTLVGDKGITLSEGQKARVNLARAIYANKDIYLLDDPLSAVDAKIGRLLFDKCVRGLLREKCVILVTHHIHYLQDANQILVLENGGRVQSRGTYEELSSTHPLLFNQIAQEADKLKKTAGNETKPKMTFDPDIPIFLDVDVDGNISDSTLNLVDVRPYGAIQIPDSTKETRSKGKVGLGLCWTYIRIGNSLFMVIILILLNIGTQVSLSFSDYYLNLWTDAEEATIQSGDSELRRQHLKWVYSGLVAFTFFAFLISTITFFHMCTKSGIVLHLALTRALLRAPIKFFENNPIGRILNRLSRDMGTVDEDVPIQLFNTTTIALQVLGGVVIVCVLSPWLIISSVAVLIFFYYIRRYFLRTSASVRRMEGIARSPIFSHLSTSLDGIKTIRGFGEEETFIRQFDEGQDVHSSVWYIYLSISSWLTTTFAWVGVLYTASVIYSFLLLLENNGSQGGLALTSVITLSGYFAAGMQNSADLENELVGVERVIEYGNIPSEAALDSSPGKKPDKSWPSKGEIRMDNACVSYSGNSEELVLKNISLHIKPKEKIGIVGRTGAGKSTLMSVLYRFVEPCSGTVEIDGVNALTIGLHDLRSNIFIIPQNPGFFSGSLRQNLDMSEKFTDDALWRVLHQVQLSARLASTAEGLDTQVGENGSNFSVGERQLICFARAILNQSRIVILDEATASVDHETDALIQGLIREKFEECTVLTIAHRLNTVMESDRICVLDGGEIVEFDEPHNLLQNPNSHLSQLVNQGGEASAATLTQLATNAHQTRIRNQTSFYLSIKSPAALMYNKLEKVKPPGLRDIRDVTDYAIDNNILKQIVCYVLCIYQRTAYTLQKKNCETQ